MHKGFSIEMDLNTEAAKATDEQMSASSSAGILKQNVLDPVPDCLTHTPQLVSKISSVKGLSL